MMTTDKTDTPSAVDAVVAHVDRGVRRRRGEFATHRCKGVAVERGKIVDKIDLRDVEVLARAKGYAMVRRKGCLPYVAFEKDLTPAPNVRAKPATAAAAPNVEDEQLLSAAVGART